MLEKVFISGCDRGLGHALAALFSSRGWEVFAGCHAVSGIEACRALPGKVFPLALDVTSEESVLAAAAEASKLTSSLGLLINNAGVLGTIDDPIDGPLDYADMLSTFDVNALGPLRLTKALLPLLLASGAARVATISSEAGSNGACSRDSWYGYAMSKAALNRGSVLLHHWLRKRGGGVLLLHPGWVRSYMRGAKDEAADFESEEAAAMAWDNIMRPLVFEDTEPRYVDHKGRRLPW